MRKLAKKSTDTRGRSFAGCVTCRTRKIKCDETHPRCRQCSRSALVCGGYEAKIRFVHYVPGGRDLTEDVSQNGRGAHSRRILFTESEQAAMSRQMQQLVDEHALDQLLKDMESNYILPPEELPQNPFLAFRLESPGKVCTEPLPLVPLVVIPNPLPAPNVQELPDPHISSPPTADLWTDPYLDDHELHSLDVSVYGNEFAEICLDLQPSSLAPSPRNEIVEPALLSPFSTHISYGINDNLEVSVSTHANFLLDHYKSQMGKLFSPLRVRKPPWSILHFPRALSALSELTIFKKAQHAHVALFYAVLAVSAFNWDNIYLESKGSTTYWRNVGQAFRHGAKKQLEKTCGIELAAEKSSKYKDILMAILTMVTISVVTGQQEEARSFLLNAEIFIKYRGILKKNKSRKLKLLHSIYLFLRVIEESTYIYPLGRLHLTSPSKPIAKMQFPSLRTHSLCLGRDLDENCELDFEAALFGEAGPNDENNTGVFQEIYGFPEELLSFISRTTYLANQITMLRHHHPQIAMNTELETQCRSLEDEIYAWKSGGEKTQEDAEDPMSSIANRIVMSPFIEAIHSAILIFFYRRIRQTNPLLLQVYVEKTITNLESFEQEQRNYSLNNCGIVWPGFIAGAEALDETLQARFHNFLANSSKTSGMRNFESAAKFLEGLWGLRRQPGNQRTTWMDQMIAHQSALILT